MALSNRKSRAKTNPIQTLGDAIAAPLQSVVAPLQALGNAVGSAAHSFDLGQVHHGLSLPQFDPNHYFAADLFTDSSPLPRTPKAAADAACASIDEKEQTLRILRANLGLNQSIVSAGISYQKLIGAAIDHGSAQVNNQTKFIGYQTAETNREIARTKLQQTQERLTQEEAVLTGLQDLTPLIREEWAQKKALKQSRIEDLKQAVFTASAGLDAQIKQLANAG